MNNFPNEKIGYRRACLLVVAIFAALLALQRVHDYDIWWHLRSGQWIVAHVSFPKTDTFSFATFGADWTYLYGLADPCFYLLSLWFGISGLQLFAVAIIAGAVASLFLFLCHRGIPPFFAAILAIWVTHIARFRFMVRPLIFKFAGIVFLFWFFYRREKLRYRYPVFFLAVLLWSWLYPAAFLAQIFAIFLLLEKIVERIFKSCRYAPGELRDALLLLALASLALLLNPSGIGLYKTVYGGFFADYAAGSYVVEEHQALIWSLHSAFAALVLLAGASFIAGRKNFRLMTPLIFVAFVVLAWGSVRYVGIASFAMAGVVGVNLTGVPLPRWLSWRHPLGWRSSVVTLAALVVGCLFLWQATFQKTRTYEFGLGINQSRYPYDAIRVLNELNFSGNVYNSWKFGGFLQWYLPAAKTFIDGRYLPAQLALYNRFQNIDLHEFSRYLTENRVQAALLDRQDLRDIDYFKAMPGFRLAHADDLSLLFVRSELLADQIGTARPDFKYLRLGGYEFDYLAPLATGPEAPLVEAEIMAAVKAAPDSFFENFLLAYYYEARKDSRAAAQYLLAARKNPGFAFTHFNLGARGGQAALKAGQWHLAAEIASLALDYQKTGELYFLLGAAQQQLKQRGAAEKSYRAALAMMENARARNNLGFLLLEMTRPDAARVIFAEGLEGRTGVDLEQSLYGLVLSLVKLQRTAEADEMRARLRKEFPQSQYLQKLR